MKLTVFVVDDEAPIRNWISYCVSEASKDYELVGSARNGKEAYGEIIEKKPDVVITDIQMPVMDGITLLVKVRERFPFTTFIILSNHAEFTYAQKAISYGAKEYLLKSEMRSSDLKKTLDVVYQEKETILRNKKSNLIHERIIDLYDLYQGKYSDNKDFWNEIGVDLQIPFTSLALPRILFDEKETIDDLIQEKGADLIIYSLYEKHFYIIMQSKNAGHLIAKEVAKILCQQYHLPIGVSKEEPDFEDSVTALYHAKQSAELYFFSERVAVYEYEKRCNFNRIDRDQVRTQLQEINTLLSFRSYNTILAKIKSMFFQTDNMSVEDSAWLRRQCLHLNTSIEEYYYSYCKADKKKLMSNVDIDTVSEYCQRFEEMLMLISNYNEQGYSETIKLALEYIHEHYAKQISLVELAKELYRAPEYFSKIFKEEVGENFSVYVIHFRLGKAKELLRSTDKRISDICYEVGYENPSYFSRLYKKYMGISPEEERKLK